MTVPVPTLTRERALYKTGAEFVIGCDEVGRGAIAGPVAVGLCGVSAKIRKVPEGLRDSKLLAEKRRVELSPVVQDWSLFSAVGLASNDEIDELGLTVALGLAGSRALEVLLSQGIDVSNAVVLLDGKFDWFTPAVARMDPMIRPINLPVSMRIKADQDCASVSGASVVAKVHRDTIMIERHEDHPHYAWRGNKGYASSEHYAAIDRVGPSDFHRRTWLRAPSTALELDFE